MPIDEEEKERIMSACMQTMPSRWPIGQNYYKRLEELGRGSWAIAFAATKVSGETQSPVKSRGEHGECKLLQDTIPDLIAVKAIVKAAHTESNLAKYPKREVDIMRLLPAHPNLVTLYAYWQDQTCFYLALEYCLNRSLSSVIKSKDRSLVLSREQISRHLTEMLLGCEYMHRHLVLHRDLKPDNVLLDAHNRAKIGDFGLSVQLKSPSEQLQSVCGTAKYQAPEMIRKLGYSFPVDVWALGVILYRLHYQVAPFDGPDSTVIYEKLLSCHVDYPKTSRFQRDILQCELRLMRAMLRKNPKFRVSIQALLADPFLQVCTVNHSTVQQATSSQVDLMLQALQQIGQLKCLASSARVRYMQHHLSGLTPTFWLHHSVLDKQTGLVCYQFNNPNLYGCTFQDGSRMLYLNYRTLVYRSAGGESSCIQADNPDTSEELKAKSRLFHRVSHRLAVKRYPKLQDRVFDAPVALNLDQLPWMEAQIGVGSARGLSGQAFYLVQTNRNQPEKQHIFQVGGSGLGGRAKCLFLCSATNSLTVLRHDDQLCSLSLAFILGNCTPQMHKFVMHLDQQVKQLLSITSGSSKAAATLKT